MIYIDVHGKILEGHARAEVATDLGIGVVSRIRRPEGQPLGTTKGLFAMALGGRHCPPSAFVATLYDDMIAGLRLGGLEAVAEELSAIPESEPSKRHEGLLIAVRRDGNGWPDVLRSAFTQAAMAHYCLTTSIPSAAARWGGLGFAMLDSYLRGMSKVLP